MTARRIFCAVAMAAAVVAGAPADAKPIKKKHHQQIHRIVDSDPRPGRWCMWWLRRHLGIPKNEFPKYEYNIAAAGRFIGSAASGPAVGVIVVWRHHVGIITGQNAKGWIVTSGNDGGAVRTRPRSLKSAIAYRWPNTRWAMR